MDRGLKTIVRICRRMDKDLKNCLVNPPASPQKWCPCKKFQEIVLTVQPHLPPQLCPSIEFKEILLTVYSPPPPPTVVSIYGNVVLYNFFLNGLMPSGRIVTTNMALREREIERQTDRQIDRQIDICQKFNTPHQYCPACRHFSQEGRHGREVCIVYILYIGRYSTTVICNCIQYTF